MSSADKHTLGPSAGREPVLRIVLEGREDQEPKKGP